MNDPNKMNLPVVNKKEPTLCSVLMLVFSILLNVYMYEYIYQLFVLGN